MIAGESATQKTNICHLLNFSGESAAPITSMRHLFVTVAL